MPKGTPKVMRLALVAVTMLISACAPLTATPAASPRPEQVIVRPDQAISAGGASAIAAGGGNLVGQSGSNALPAPDRAPGISAPAAESVASAPMAVDP